MNYHTLSTPQTSYTLKTPQYYHKTGQKGKEKSITDIKYNPDQYSILGERTLEFLKKRERGGMPRTDIEIECLDVLMTLDVEVGLQAAHYEDQVMLEKALQKITQMARDNGSLKELKDLLNVLVNQRKILKEKEDAFLNSLSVFIDFYARGDFELIQKGIIKEDFLAKELEQLHKLLAQKGKLMQDRKRFHFDLNSFLQQPAKPPTPVVEYTPPVEKVITPPPPKKEPEPPTNIYMGGMPPFQVPTNLKMEWPYVTGLSHRFPRGATNEVEQLEYLKAMEADLLLNLRKIPPFSPEYAVTSSHLNLIRQLLGNYDKKKYHWLDYSHEIVNLPSQTIKPTKLIHYQVPFDDNGPVSLNNISTSPQKRVGSSPNITVERSGTPGGQNIIAGQQFPPGNHTQKITQKYRLKINVNDIEGINGFRFKFHKMEKLMEKYGTQFTVRGALLFGDEVYIDKNGDNCSFSAVINGRRSENDPSKVLGRAKRDFDIDMRPVLSEFHTIEDLEKFKLLLNVFDKDGKLIGWEVFPMYTNLRFNKGRYTLSLNAPPSQKPPFSDPKTPLDIEMQHEIIPLPCPDSDDDSDDEYIHVSGRSKKFYNDRSSVLLDGFDDPADRIRIQDDNSLERNKFNKYRMPIPRKRGDDMFDDVEDSDNKFQKQNNNSMNNNQESNEQKKLNNDRQKRNMLKLSEFDNVHGFRLKFNSIKNYDMKKGGNITVRLAVVYGTTVIKDLNGLQCADSKDIVGLASKNDKTGLDLNYLRDFDIDLYDLVDQYDYTELEKFNIIANMFDGEGNQLGWHIIPLFKYRKFNKGKTNTFLFEPPALPPPFEGQKNNSKFKIESELIPFPIDKNIDILVDEHKSNSISNRNLQDSARNNNNSLLKSGKNNPTANNNDRLNSSMNNNNSLLGQNKLGLGQKNIENKKSVIPNIKETDKAIQIRFKNLKNYDLTKGKEITIRGSIIFGDDIMVDDNDLRCAYHSQFQATVSSERNTLSLNKDCIYNLNPNQLSNDYDIKQLESIQIYYSIFDSSSNQIGWLVFPLFKNKRMNKGTFTSYLLEPPAQQPPFNLQSIKNSKTRLEYEIMTSEYQADHLSEQSSVVSEVVPAGAEQPDFNNKIGVSIYLKEVKNQKEKISIAYHLKICDSLNTKLILSRDNQPCYFETDSVFDPDTKLKNNLIDEKVFFLLDPERLKRQYPNYSNLFLSIFFLKENPQKIEEGEAPYGWFAQGLFDNKGVFKTGTYTEKIFKLPEQQQYPLQLKTLKKLDSSIEFTIEIVDIPDK